jgi:iron complex outermembrane receptor protein
LAAGLSRTILIVALAFWLCGPALAQDDKPANEVGKAAHKAEHKMEDMVVTATRTEVEADKAPASVTVITRQDMEKKNIRTVDDALKNEAGIYTSRTRGIQDVSASVSMRGLAGQKRTLVLVDGIPFQDGYSNTTIWGDIPTDSIERIEVIRGPGSALYGGNAMGGVINIILRVPMKTEAMARAGIGTGWSNTPDTKTQYYDYRTGVNAGTRLGDKVSVFGGFESEYNTGYPGNMVVKSATTKGSGNLVGGYPTQSSTGTASWVVGDSGNTMGQRIVANGLAAWDLTDTGRLRFDVLFGTQSYDYGRPNSYVGGALNGTPQALPGYTAGAIVPGNFVTGPGQFHDYQYRLSYDEMFEKLNFKAKAAYFQNYQWNTSPTSTSLLGYDAAPGMYTFNVRSSWYFDLQGTYPIFETNNLTLGGTFRNDRIDLYDKNMTNYEDISTTTNTIDRTRGQANTWAAFVEDEWKLLPYLTLYTGLRFDFWTSYDGASGNEGAIQSINPHQDSSLSPRVALVWSPWDDTTLKGQISRGFRAPNLYEQLRALTSFGITTLPNSNLKPETMWTYELGGNQYLWDKKIKLGATAFHTDFNNYIDTVSVGGSSSVTQQQNVGQVAVNGLELQGSIKPWDWVNLWGNLTLNDSKITKFNLYPQYVGHKLPTIPAYEANLGVDFKWRMFKLSFMGNYAGQIYSGYQNDNVFNSYGSYSSCWVWDSKLTYSATKNMDVIFSVTNLFNQRYFRYYAGQPTTGLLEVKFKF